jgi:hypothetical protein
MNSFLQAALILSSSAFTIAVLGAEKIETKSVAVTVKENSEDVVRLDASNIIFLYEAYADLPSTLERLAHAYSSDYREARDEFAKQQLLEKLKPVLTRKTKEAAELDSVMIRLRWSAPEYDFKRQGFTSGISSSSFVPFDVSGCAYAASYKGVKPFSFVPVPEAEASSFSKILSHSRDGYLEIFGTVVSAEEVEGRKTVVLKLKKVSCFLSKGQKLGEISLPAK